MIPVGFSPKSIFSSTDAANWRKTPDSFFVGKISYYMVTPTTSFYGSDSKTKKLMGGNGVCKGVGCCEEETFIFRPRHSSSPRNFCRSLVSRARNFSKRGKEKGKRMGLRTSKAKRESRFERQWLWKREMKKKYYLSLPHLIN